MEGNMHQASSKEMQYVEKSCYVEKYEMYKLCVQIHTPLPGGKSPWYSKGHTTCKQVTRSLETTEFDKSLFYICCSVYSPQ